MFGYSAEECLGRNTEQFYPNKDDYLKAGERIEELINSGKKYSRIERLLKKKNGEIFLAEISTSIMILKDGSNQLVSIARDLSKEMDAKLALIESQEQLEQIFSKTHVMIAYMDTELNFIRVNKAYADADDKEPDYFNGKNHHILYPNREFEKIFRDVVKTGLPYQTFSKPFVYEKNPERSTSYWDWNLYPIKDSEGKVESLILSLIDVSDHVRAEKAVLEGEKKYRAFFEGSKDAIYITSVDGNFEDVNDAFLKLFGYEKDEALAVKATSIYSNPAERENFQKIIESKGSVRNYELTLKRKDGTEIQTHVTSNAIRDGDNDIIGYQGIIRDMTESIKTAAERASEVVQDLLTLARRGRYDMKPLNINDMIEEYFNSSTFETNKARHPDVSYKLELDENVALIKGSSPHLSKTIMNLVINAFESMTYGGNMTLRTFSESLENRTLIFGDLPKGNYTIIEIQDTGYGIEEEDLPHIFEPFYTRKEMGRSGSGLGLSVVFGVIQDHIGYLDVSPPKKGWELLSLSIYHQLRKPKLPIKTVKRIYLVRKVFL